ncbi:MAG: extracellular solute-binding protein family 1 [Paenibacillus sp.]|jgi:multiple sugar transport system substrate-binding protein|nr:extracellular solute-binding protein family 1 [Paenibacillus sp.]
MKSTFKMKALLVAASAALLVSACGGKAGNDEPAKAAEPAKETTYPPANLVIYSTSGWTEEAFNERFGNSIRKKFPQHTFTYIQSKAGANYPDLVSTGQQIDIVWESIARFPSGPMMYNMQFDMTDLIKLHKVDMSKFEPTMIDLMKEMSGGKMYALPVLNNTVVLYYNKDIFDKFGVAYPKDGMTWDETIELSRKLTRVDGNVEYVGMGFGHFFATNALSLGFVDPKTSKPTIMDEKWKTLYQTYTRIAEPQVYKDKVRKLKKIPDVTSFVKDRDVAMLSALANTHMTQDMKTMNWDVVKVPTFKEAPQNGPQSYPTYFGVSGISKFKDQSMEVIKYLVSEEFQLEVSKTGTLPVIKTPGVKEAYAKDTAFASKNIKVAFYDRFAPMSPKTIYDTNVERAYNKNLISLMLGETDLNTLLRTAEEESIKAIADQKK